MYRKQRSRPSPRKMQKGKMVVWGGLTNSCEKKRSKRQGEKERYTHLNAEFQRTARRDKKAFLSDQCKEIEEGFLISPCSSLELYSQICIAFLFCFAFHFSCFHSYLQDLPRQSSCFFEFLFHGDGLVPSLLYNVTNLSPQFITHSIYQIQALKSISHFHCIMVRDLIQIIPEWSSGFPYFLQFKSEFCIKEFMI